MQIQLTLHCGRADNHTLTIDDMVITNWTETIRNDPCGAMTMIVPSIMDEILKWRANWRNKPDHDEFQDIHDLLSPTPAAFSHHH